PHTAGAIKEWFKRPRNQEFVEKLRRAGVKLEQEAVEELPSAEGSLAGLTFVITGTLSRPRQEVAAMIEQHGGKVVSSVSGNTDYRLVGDSPGGTKYRKAQQLGTPVIGEAELMKMMRQNRGDAATGGQLSLPLG
ncbi:MAG: hypothetical protein DRI48_09310, partial [Chloroflexi bacterium]